MSYNGSLTREQFMFYEMRITARLKLVGFTDDEVLSKVYAENLYQYPTEKELKSKCKACLKRLACIRNIPALLEVLANGTVHEAKQAALIAMMCQSRLLAEFMVAVIGEKYRILDMTLTKKDMNLFFLRLAEQDEAVASWSENTVQKLKTVIRSCLKETAYLAGNGSETLQPVFLSDELVHALEAGGLRSLLPAFHVLN